jgi:hypothetical protein
MFNNKRGVFIPLLIIMLVIFIIIAVIEVGKICIGITCIQLVNPKLTNEFHFWSLVLMWLAFQIGLVYGYIKIIGWTLKLFKLTKPKFEHFIKYLKHIFS